MTGIPTREIESFTGRVHEGDARAVLGDMPPDSVHMCMTSPPYYALRDYGDGTESIWGGDPGCDHRWDETHTMRQGGTNTADNPPDVAGNQTTQGTALRGDGYESVSCVDCGAWRGQFGLQPTSDMFVDHLCNVCDEVGRVLRDDGVFWLNLGDTYLEKDKQLIPQRVVLELQERGWHLRNDIVWEKPDAMPESCTDRLATRFESLFLLTRSDDYWFDLDRIREPYADVSKTRRNYPDSTQGPYAVQKRDGDSLHDQGKNPGDIWTVATANYTESHYAVFPEELCERPIKAGCPPVVCGECGEPYAIDGEQQCGCGVAQTHGGIALDPFCGRGTLCKVAAEHGRKYVGVDLDSDAVRLARDFVPSTGQSTFDQYRRTDQSLRNYD